MKKYLFDTDICVFYIRGKFDLKAKFKSVKKENKYISELTLAELKFGVRNSDFIEENQKAMDNFLTGVQILPIYYSLDLYADEKVRLRKMGKPVDEFDLLIGVSAVVNDMIMVTNNEAHFERINNIKIENWTK